MKFRAKRRDACEKPIVAALRAAGCSVTQLDGRGVPDLLVGFRGRTILIECKDPVQGDRNSRARGKKVANPLGLRETQWKWWSENKGAQPFIATTPEEALAALGAGPMVGDGVFGA